MDLYITGFRQYSPQIVNQPFFWSKYAKATDVKSVLPSETQPAVLTAVAQAEAVKAKAKADKMRLIKWVIPFLVLTI